MLGKDASAQVNPGDKFVKVDDPGLVWTVSRIVRLPNLPQHAELVGRTVKTRKVLVSTAALRDRRLYRPVRESEARMAGQAQDGAERPRRGWRALLGF